MITQSIEVHKTTYTGHLAGPVNWNTPRTPNPNAPYAEAPPMDKIAYAQFLGTLGFSKGDFITFHETSKAHGEETYSVWSVSWVQDIIEIHHMVKEWGTNKSGPRCIYIMNWASGQTPSQSGRLTGPSYVGAKLFKKIKPEEVPIQFRLLVDDYIRNQSSQTTSTSPEQTPPA